MGNFFFYRGVVMEFYVGLLGRRVSIVGEYRGTMEFWQREIHVV